MLPSARAPYLDSQQGCHVHPRSEQPPPRRPTLLPSQLVVLLLHMLCVVDPGKHSLWAFVDKGTCQKRFSGIRPLRGYPPLPPALTENQSEKKKVFFLSGKGGYPPPLNGKSAKLFREIFS